MTMARTYTPGDLLIQSLGDAIAYEKGELRARVRVNELTAREAQVDAPPHFDKERIRAARLKPGYSQLIFAKARSVSTQTVKAQEQGTRTPDGPTRRLLEVAEEAPEILRRKVHPRAAAFA